MIELMQKRPTTLAMLAVAWFVWGGLGAEPEAKSKSTDGLPQVGREDVAVRPVDAPPVQVRNPFPDFMAPEDGGFYNPEAEQAEKDAEAEADEPEEAPPPPPKPRIVLERRPAFVLRLDSIMAFGADGGHARINGHTVRVGDVIPGCDDERPPQLVDLDGLRATVVHRDLRYVLHLDEAPSLALGGETIRHVLPPLPVKADDGAAQDEVFFEMLPADAEPEPDR